MEHTGNPGNAHTSGAGVSTDLRQVNTFCRICEPSCGLIAHVDGGRLV